MEFLNSPMPTDLLELWKIPGSLRGTGVTMGMESAERYMRVLLERTKEFIARYRPESYTLSVWSELGIGVSFIWESKNKPEFRLPANA